MKKNILIPLIFIPLLSFAQTDIGLNIGSNYPISYVGNNSVSKLGFEFGIDFSKELKNKLDFKYGLFIETYNYTFSTYIPIQFNYKINQGQLKLNYGLFIAGKNLYHINNSDDFANTANVLNYDLYRYGRVRCYGIDINLGLSYEIIKKLRIYFNCWTPVIYYPLNRGTDNMKYIAVSIGLNYKIVSR
ncbi:MAG: hypothetical protein JEZ09_05400 [Salinivirgaceae bacterium]|nr:hypothetical protein [Salinivirgaceae bacterium]